MYYNTHKNSVMTDARHDSTSNAYHTTVACLSGRYSGMLCCHIVCIQSVYTTAPLRLWGYAQSLGNSIQLPRHENLSALKLCCRRSFPEVLN